jgi:hypothetical protein
MAFAPARERVRKSRERKRRGVIPVHVEVSTLEVDLHGNAQDSAEGRSGEGGVRAR